MKIYDITQELFSSALYPGDMAPTYERVREISKGDICNLTNVSMSAHNGTHIDAPAHFIEGGKTIDQLDLETLIGEAKVITVQGNLTVEDVKEIMEDAPKRVLLKGKAELTEEAAEELNRQEVRLLGVEAQSVGPVHVTLLSKDVVLLEGIRLEQVEDGTYLLMAAPLKLGGADGAPCRAVLISGLL